MTIDQIESKLDEAYNAVNAVRVRATGHKAGIKNGKTGMQNFPTTYDELIIAIGDLPGGNAHNDLLKGKLANIQSAFGILRDSFTDVITVLDAQQEF